MLVMVRNDAVRVGLLDGRGSDEDLRAGARARRRGLKRYMRGGCGNSAAFMSPQKRRGRGSAENSPKRKLPNAAIAGCPFLMQTCRDFFNL